MDGYDDSLSYASITGSADAEILWYDALSALESLREDGFSAWFQSRLADLRSRSTAPILVCLIGVKPQLADTMRLSAEKLPGVRFADVYGILPPGELFDERFIKVSGSRLSERANMLIARRLGSSWLPSLLRPRLKALLVDLDHTLYQGILGEEGLAVELTPGHRKLQEGLLHLRSTGVFLGLISRNEEQDARNLFDVRKDFPLRWDSFSTHQIGWGLKSASVERACSELRISPNAAVYIDDNLGELLEISAHHPELAIIHASPDGELTSRALAHFPGLWSWGSSDADMIRQADLHANQARASIAERTQSDPHAYFRELAPELTLKVSVPETARRLHELSQKTNQFNLSLRRLSEVEVDRYLRAPGTFTVGIALKDRLSDSGLIAAMFGEIRDGLLRVDEWVISCRALGRGLEDFMASQALIAALDGAGVAEISFAYAMGPRNSPARDWLARFSGRVLEPKSGQVTFDANVLRTTQLPISLRIEKHEKSRD